MRGIIFGAALAAFGGFVSQDASALSGYRLLQLEGHYVKWGSPRLGTAATVSYAVVDRSMSFPEARNCGAMVSTDGLLSASAISRSAFGAEVRAAFAIWERVANIRFRPANDPLRADILIGAQATPRGWAFTNVAFEQNSGGGSTQSISKALICLNPEKRWKIGFDGNIDVYDLRYTLMHEIGHAIGLDHPGPSEQVMSFKYLEQFRSLQIGDASGAGALYGNSGSPTFATARDAADPVNGGKPVPTSAEPQLSLGQDDEPSQTPRPARLK